MRRLETHVLVLVVVLVAAAVTSSASELLHRKRIRDLSDDDQDGLHTFYHNDVFKSSQLIRQKRVKRTPKKAEAGHRPLIKVNPQVWQWSQGPHHWFQARAQARHQGQVECPLRTQAQWQSQSEWCKCPIRAQTLWTLRTQARWQGQIRRCECSLRTLARQQCQIGQCKSPPGTQARQHVRSVEHNFHFPKGLGVTNH